MRLSVEKIVRLLFLILLLLFATGCASHMLLMEDSFLVTNLHHRILILAFLAWGAAIVCMCFLPGFKIYTMPLTLTAYMVYLLWIIVPTLIMATMSQESIVMKVIYTWMPILTLPVAYCMGRNYGHSRSAQWGFLLIGAFCAMQFSRLLLDFSAVTEESHLVAAYYVMYALPLMMLVKSKFIRVALAMVVMIVIFASFKRGGLVALVLGLIVYLVVLQFIANKMNIGSILVGMVVLAVFAVIFIILGTSGDHTLFDRFQDVGSSTGSGRTLVWPVTLGMIENSDLTGLLFGHGYGAVQLDSPVMLSAHNDFLEITYDYGLLGIVLYVTAFVSLGFYVLRMIGRKSVFAPSMAMMYTVYVILSLISHIAIYYWMSLVMLTVGYCIGCEKYEENSSLIEPNMIEQSDAGNE